MRRETWMLAPAVMALILGGCQAKARGDVDGGFLYNGTTYTALAVPGAMSTFANGVSGGNVVGYYVSGGTIYGFLYNGTTYTTLAPPGATRSDAIGVSGGNVVGDYESGGIGYGFLYNGTTYTTLALPGATLTVATGVSGGNVVGYSVVPEPSGLVLLGMGFATTAGYFSLRRRRPSATA